MTSDVARLPIVFALPAGSELPSGGNIYNRELIAELRTLVPVETTDFSGAAPRLAAGEPGIYLFDTLDLARASELESAEAGQRRGLVVHYLPSLQPNLSEGHPSLAIEAAALTRFDFFVATSDFTRARLVDRGCSARAIVVVPPAARAATAGYRRYSGPLAGLVVANLVPGKGVLPLLEALEELGPAPYSLCVVGRTDADPEYAAACLDVLRRSDWLHERVELVGPVPPDQMTNVYGAAGVLLSAARMETFGMAILEARTHGLPVLARDAGNVRHHFEDGEADGLFGSDAALAERFVALALDGERMAAWFDRAQRTRPRADYTWKVAATRLVQELDSGAGFPAEPKG